MDRELVDGVHEPGVVRRDAEPATPDTADLPSQIGNQAFTSLVRGGAVDRSAPKSQGAGPLDPEIGAEISTARGGGAAMADPVRGDMEAHLGADLSGVRVHTDGNADRLNRSVQAEAFTSGSDVFFKSGKYSPESTDGRRLLAHELTHVVQQGTGQTDGAGRVSHPDDPHEHEARSVGDAVANAPVASTDAGGSTDSSVSRQEEEEEEMQASPDPDISRQEEEEEMQM
jgi:hypothetical protein